MERLFNLDPQLLADTVLLMLAMLVMYTLLSYLLFNPARDFLKKRQERIKNDIDTAQADKEQAKLLKEDYDARIKNINKEADEILSQARQKALQNAEDIKAQANEEAARIIARAQAQRCRCPPETSQGKCCRISEIPSLAAQCSTIPLISAFGVCLIVSASIIFSRIVSVSSKLYS